MKQTIDFFISKIPKIIGNVVRERAFTPAPAQRDISQKFANTHISPAIIPRISNHRGGNGRETIQGASPLVNTG